MKPAIRFISVFILIFALTKPAAIAQETDDNEKLISNLVVEQLRHSELISNIDERFRLRSTLPPSREFMVYDYLSSQNLPVIMNGNDDPLHVLRLTVESSNKLTQERRGDPALRLLEGEIQLLFLNPDSQVLEGETLRFSYQDEVDARYAESLESNWPASRFAEKDVREERNLWRTIGEPAIIVAATGISVFLLYNVRSN